MDPVDKTTETLVDNPEVAPTLSTHSDMELDQEESRVDQLNASTLESLHASPCSTGEVFPMLGPAPEHWKASLLELIEKIPDTYLDSEDNRENRRRMPEWIDSAVQAISRVSGALLDVRAVCTDSEDPETARCYTITTTRLQPHRENEEMAEEIAYLADLIFRAFGPTMERRPPHTFPTVYSTALVRGRPLLCPMHPNARQRRLTLIEYMMIYRRWQCGDEIDMNDVAKEINSFIEPQRYGAGVVWGTGPQDWDDRTVTLCYLHVYTNQERLLLSDLSAESTAFQWILRSSGEPFRYEPWGAVTDLYKDEHAAYSVAMARFNFPSHAYQPQIAGDPMWFNATLIAELRTYFELPDALVQAMELTEINETMTPPVRAATIAEPALLKLIPIEQTDVLRLINSVRIPTATYDWADSQHDLLSARSLYVWVVLQESLIVDNRVAGGLEGARKLILALLAFCKLIHDMSMDQIRLSGHMYRITWDHQDGQQIQSVIDYLNVALARSIESDSRPPIYPGTREDQWKPKRLLHFRLGSSLPDEMPWPYARWGTTNPLLSSPVTSMHDDISKAGRSTLPQHPDITTRSSPTSTPPQSSSGIATVIPGKGKGKAVASESTMEGTALKSPKGLWSFSGKRKKDSAKGTRGVPYDEPRQPGRPHMARPASVAQQEDDPSQLVSPQEPDQLTIEDFDLQYGNLIGPVQLSSTTLPPGLARPTSTGRAMPGPPWASTGETRPTPLPRVSEEVTSRRSQSLDRPVYSAQPGNALGLQVPLSTAADTAFGPLLGTHSELDISFAADAPSSTPQQRTRSGNARRGSGSSGRPAKTGKGEPADGRAQSSETGMSGHHDAVATGSSSSRPTSQDRIPSITRSPPVESSAIGSAARRGSTLGRRTQTPQNTTSRLPSESPTELGDLKDNYLLQAAALVKRGRTPGPSIGSSRATATSNTARSRAVSSKRAHEATNDSGSVKPGAKKTRSASPGPSDDDEYR